MVAMKGVIPNTTPLFLAGFRLLPAGFLVLFAAQLMGREQPKTLKSWLWISLFALVDGVMFQGFLAEGLARTSAGLGSVMIDSQPLAVALMALWLFGDRIGTWGWLGLGLGVVGISVLGLPEDWLLDAGQWVVQTIQHGDWAIALDLSLPQTGPDPASLAQGIVALFQNGQWLMLLAALSMAVGTIIARLLSREVDSVVATGWHMVIAGLPLFVASALTEAGQWSHLDGSNWLALAYSTVFGSAVSYGMFFYFATRGSLTSLSSLTFLTPVFALLFGNLLLGEVLSPLKWCGVGLTLVSICLVNQREQLSRWGQGSHEPVLSPKGADPTGSTP